MTGCPWSDPIWLAVFGFTQLGRCELLEPARLGSRRLAWATAQVLWPCVPGVGRDGGGAQTGDDGSAGVGLHPTAGRVP